MISTGQALCQRRQQDLPLPEWQDRISIPTAKESQKNSLDNVVPTDAQEGYL